MADGREQIGDVVFENSDSRAGLRAALLFGGIGLIGFSIVAFVVAIVSQRHPGTLELHVTTTLPMIIAIGLITQWFSLRKLPSRVVVGPGGMEVTTRQATSRYSWSEIGSATSVNVLNSKKMCLRVTDTAGKTLVGIDESFPDYKELVTLVQSYVDAKADDTAITILSRKAKRMGLVCFVFGSLLTAAAVFVAIETHSKQRAKELLAAKGVPGEAEIIRRFVAPNGVTRRLEYRVQGAAVRSVEVEPFVWGLLENAKTVPVIYVPNEPDVSQVVAGEVEDDDFAKKPGGGYLVAGLGGLMALFMLAFSPFAWMGYDLALDDKTRIWKVKRYGRVIWASREEEDEVELEEA